MLLLLCQNYEGWARAVDWYVVPRNVKLTKLLFLTFVVIASWLSWVSSPFLTIIISLQDLVSPWCLGVWLLVLIKTYFTGQALAGSLQPWLGIDSPPDKMGLDWARNLNTFQSVNCLIIQPSLPRGSSHRDIDTALHHNTTQTTITSHMSYAWNMKKQTSFNYPSSPYPSYIPLFLWVEQHKC